ncbi:hypothetical protein [Desulfolutivibrio sulfoxidireducens]|uniref:hypothetical protein n=1 Tax=Desulfolutivibrio sulfoxidireducens TaxID=2773299 RepID=UPI00159D5E1C|nr:hypothetical protein [Desulfolutivibrio sulfoxidireducens]QLA17072.1 hypothetical protein GD605_13705 [Desulfolutivibrio sulfoxidireducens]QLA20640.1 hypothetical protein GD604_13420 [Desulfolutivibrio sulfoxidireducens]
MRVASRRVSPLSTIVPLMLLVVLLPGCAVLNEGAVNYRKQKFSTSGGNTPEPLELVKKFDTDANKDKAILSSRGDTVSIHLTQGFIKSFTELPSIWKGELFGPSRAEIAVVVNVSSLKDSEIDFKSTAQNTGRLVYYNDDVRKNQYLNFSYIPVFGPVAYDGYPLAMQIYIIEMDAEDAQIKPLLHTMASIGSSLYSPSAPVLSLLDSLGSALLSGNTDDILMRYHMTFYPNTGELVAHYPVLETGNYVLVRRGNRNEGPGKEGDKPAFDWDKVRLDPEDGRLVWGDDPKKCFTDETYLVFQVQRGFPADTLKSATSYAAFRAQLVQEAEKSGQDMADAALAFAGATINSTVYTSLRNRIKEILNSVHVTDDSTRFMAWNFVSEFAKQIAKMDGTDEKQKIGALTNEQRALLMSLLVEASGIATEELETDLMGDHLKQKSVVEAIVTKKKGSQTPH